MRIHAIVCCINYSEMFRWSIDRWALGVERLVVMTSPEDVKTQELCRHHNVECIPTDVWYENGASLNKGAGLSLGIMQAKLRENADWLLSFDADMYPPADWRQRLEAYNPNPGFIYGTHRYWVPSNATEDQFVEDPKRLMPQRDVIGFFQLFHATDPRLPADPIFPCDYAHCGWYDSVFARRWEFPKFQRFLPFDLIHIGEERRNWLGIGKDKECEEMLRYGDRYSEKVVPPKLNPRRSQKTKNRTAFIQLASAGDLVSLLPIFKLHRDRGEDVSVLVRPEYADVLEVASYVKVIPVDIPNRTPFAAEAKAREMGFENVIVSQTFHNDRPLHNQATNYQVETWLRCGEEAIGMFHESETVLDRRDNEAETAAVAALVPSGPGKLIVCNLSGKSQPYAHIESMRAWIRSEFLDYRLVDLTDVRLAKSHHLLGIIEAADVVMTVDTLIVHLANALNKPLIVIYPDAVYARSEPKKNWKCACTHTESTSEEYRDEIAKAVRGEGRDLTRHPTQMSSCRVWHPVNYYWTDEADKAEVMAAYRTWDAMQANNRGFRNVFYERGAGPDAKLVDVLDLACKEARDNDVILFADRKTPICESYVQTAQAMKQDTIEIQQGVFVLRVSWLKKNRQSLMMLSALNYSALFNYDLQTA